MLLHYQHLQLRQFNQNHFSQTKTMMTKTPMKNLIGIQTKLEKSLAARQIANLLCMEPEESEIISAQQEDDEFRSGEKNNNIADEEIFEHYDEADFVAEQQQQQEEIISRSESEQIITTENQGNDDDDEENVGDDTHRNHNNDYDHHNDDYPNPPIRSSTAESLATKNRAHLRDFGGDGILDLPHTALVLPTSEIAVIDRDMARVHVFAPNARQHHRTLLSSPNQLVGPLGGTMISPGGFSSSNKNNFHHHLLVCDMVGCSVVLCDPISGCVKVRWLGHHSRHTSL